MAEGTQGTPTPKRRILPRPHRYLTLALFLLGFLFLPPTLRRGIIPAFSPFSAVCSSIALRTVTLTALATLPMLVLLVMRRRLFCRHLCPMGTVLDSCAGLRRWRKRERPTYGKVPAIGQILAMLTLGGALFTCPLFLWLDPLVLFSGALAPLREPFVTTYLLYAAGFGVLILLSFIWPGLWCTKLCPLGGTQDFLSDIRRACARKADAPQKTGRGLTRRSLMRFGAGAACAIFAGRLLRARKKRPLRPPCAVSEEKFKALCTRCGACGRVCPTAIIQPELDLSDPGGFMTPTLNLAYGNCEPDCSRCTQTCPSGALTPTDIDEKNDWVIATAVLNMKACLLSQDQECGACTTVCPRDAIIEGFDQEAYLPELSIDAQKCNGCGICLKVCPVAAITLIPGINGKPAPSDSGFTTTNSH